MPRRTDPGDRLAVAHDHLVRAVEDLAAGDAWRRMLEVAARFPAYSPNNVLLIGIQRPDATRVCGIRSWNALGRHVRKGEKGIAILAPCLYRPRATGPDARSGPKATGTRDDARPDPDKGRQLRGFRVVHVFDQAQTEGQPLDEITPAELRGGAPPELIERLAALLTEDGYAVERGPCGSAYGYTDFRERTVRVRDDVEDSQAAKSLAHEAGHVRADHEHRFLAQYGTSAGCRAQAEVEAESIAYVVTAAAGMSTEDYSVPYLAGWSGGNAELLRTAATRVLSTARGIVTDLGLAPPDLGAAHDTAIAPDPAARQAPSPARDPAGR